MTTHDRHDLIEFRRTLGQIGDATPKFDIEAFLARADTAESSPPPVDELAQRRRTRGSRALGPWATGAAAAALLTAVVIPAALDGPLVAADGGSTPATQGAAVSGTEDAMPPAFAGSAPEATVRSERATPQPTPPPFGRPSDATGRPSPHPVPPAIPPTPALPPDVRIGQPPIPVPLPTGAEGSSSMEALLEGRPVLRSWGCVVVQTTDGRRLPVVWPHGFTTVRQGQDLVILDAEGGRVGVIGTDGRPGTLLEFGGGHADVGPVGTCGDDARGQAFLIGSVAPAG